MDPQYGYPYSMEHIPREVGILLAYEETGYIKAGKDGKERKSQLIEGWSVSKARRAGADAVKLLIPYRPDASEEVCKHQQELVLKVGIECEQYDIPFLLELTSYALSEGKTDSIAFAKKKPEIVAKSAAEFSEPDYKVDILKLEFPAELKYAEEYCDKKLFDNEARPAAYNLSEVREFCKKVDEASQLPWVILSAGVDIEEFLVNLELATEAGASGFLCGRAIWKEAIDFYHEGIGKVRKFLISKGVDNFKRANEKAKRALPWFEHKKYKGLANVVVASLGPSWYKDF
jgi:tagatose 1,6-diphosphate aldolase